jgi:hypothetical protein
MVRRKSILVWAIVAAGFVLEAGPASAFEPGDNVHVANVVMKNPMGVTTNIFDATSKTPAVGAGLQWNGETWTAQITYLSGMQVMAPGSQTTDPDINAPEYAIFCEYNANKQFVPCNQAPPAWLARGIALDASSGALSFAGGGTDYWTGGSYYPAVRDRKNGVPDVDGIWFAHTYNATDGKKWLASDDPAYFLFVKRPDDKDTALTCTMDGGVSFKLVLQKYTGMSKDSNAVLTYGDDGAVSGFFKVDDNDLIGWKYGIPGTKLFGDSTSVDRVTGNIVVSNSPVQSRTTGHCAVRASTRAF